MGRIKHFKGETIDLEIDSNERKEAELSKNRLGDHSCFQTTGHIQAIPPPECTKKYNPPLYNLKSAPPTSPTLLSPLLSPLHLISAPAREAGQLTPRQKRR